MEYPVYKSIYQNGVREESDSKATRPKQIKVRKISIVNKKQFNTKIYYMCTHGRPFLFASVPSVDSNSTSTPSLSQPDSSLSLARIDLINQERGQRISHETQAVTWSKGAWCPRSYPLISMVAIITNFLRNISSIARLAPSSKWVYSPSTTFQLNALLLHFCRSRVLTCTAAGTLAALQRSKEA